MFFAGVEGGATGSQMVVVNQEGQVLARSETGQTNQWQIGLAACANRIRDMLEDCKTKAGITEEITALGLGLSGLDTEQEIQALRDAITGLNLAKSYYLCNDTLSTLATATDAGGVVLIAGTGSNCLLVEDDGTSYRCGGWGHMLGDEGSAFHVAHTALKIVADHQEGFKPCSMDTTCAFTIMKNHFDIANRMHLLQYLYDKFEKSNIAKMAVKLAEGADAGDELCRYIFSQAGEKLGRHVQAVLRFSKPATRSRLITVVCTGGLFKSFHLLKSGFMKGIQPAYDGDVPIPAFRLVLLKDTAAIGAAYLAAQHSQNDITLHYESLSEIFFSHAY